jgi:chaperone modulatory protein CbpM
MSEPRDAVQFLDGTVFFAFEEVVHLTGLSAAELAELAEIGVLPPDAGGRYPAQVVHAGRRAARLRAAFELDAAGLALTARLLARIEELEARLHELACQMPR